VANAWDFTGGIVGQGSYESLKIFVIRILFFRVLFVSFNWNIFVISVRLLFMCMKCLMCSVIVSIARFLDLCSLRPE